MIKKILLLAAILSFSSISEANQETEARAIKNLKKAVELIASGDRSCSTETDCDLMAIGHRACGGVGYYTFTSRLNSNYNEVSFLADQTFEKERSYNEKYDIISICSAAMKPEMKCENFVCKKK